MPDPTQSRWGSYGDMWAERDRAREEEMGTYQPLDPKADKSPAWLTKAAQGFGAYPGAPAQAASAPADLGGGLVSPWTDYGQKPDEQIKMDGIRQPWDEDAEADAPGGDGIQDPWGANAPRSNPQSPMAPKAEAWGWAKKPNAAFDGDPRFQAGGDLAPREPASETLPGGIVRENPYGEAPKKAEPSSIGKAANAFSTVFGSVMGSSKGVDEYRPREAQNVEVTGAKFRTADDGSVFFRGADGAEYSMNPNDPNVQRAMAADARRVRPAAPRTDDWDRIRRGE